MFGLGKSAEKSIQQSGEPANISRRGFLRYSGAAAITTALGVVAAKSKYEYDNPPAHEGTPVTSLPHPQSEAVVSQPEVLVESTESPQFDEMCAAYKKWWEMPYRSVFFVDVNNNPVGDLVPFAEFTVMRQKDGVEKPYLLTPGEMDENGFLTGNLAKEWIVYVRAVVAEKAGCDPADLQVKHNTEEIEQALRDTDEPALRAAILSGEIDTVAGIIDYYSSKPVEGVETETLDSFLRTYISWDEPGITPVMDAELRELVPCLVGRESGFKDGIGAANGVGQFLSPTWKDLMGSEYGEEQHYTTQVEAIGKYVGQLYRELLRKNGQHYFDVVRAAFSSAAAFEKHFLVPCLLNAYTAGALTIQVALKSFLKEYPIENKVEVSGALNNQDFFFDFITYARKRGGDYGDKCLSYTPMIYALRDVQKEHAEKKIKTASL